MSDIELLRFINDNPIDVTRHMKFKVHSRNEVERNGIALVEPYVMISISCPNDPANIPNRENCKDILRLEFDDLDQPIHILGDMKCKLFSQDDAKIVLDFYRKHRENFDYMIVHCDAGISRSSAVACALKKIETGSDYEMFKRYIPNRRVYSLILSEYYTHPTKEQGRG